MIGDYYDQKNCFFTIRLNCREIVVFESYKNFRGISYGK
jgi:hypothetical protein